ncbi:MAG: HEAT repeat domain-containing protein [Desulfobacterales bacterium]|nr:HEAT repeat domain-containing protein [Desulfobacterales bacterium]
MTNKTIIILIGLVAAQILATLHVYLSNTELFNTLKAVTEAGYLAVPNTHVMQSLKGFWPAFCGGIFFTLTVGAFLTLFSFACIITWDSTTGRSNSFLIMLVIFWLSSIFAVNSNGICPTGITHFVLIPATVFGAVLIGKRKPEVKIPEVKIQDKENSEIENQKSKIKNLIIHIVFFSVLALTGSMAITEDIFVKIRDNLLLSNPVGIKVNSFYYKYTLYAAEVFKSDTQKLMRTCRLSIDNKTLARQMKKILLNYNYLVIDKETDKVNLDIVQKAANNEQQSITLFFKKNNRITLETTSREFSSKPWQILKDFSEKNDRHIFLRTFTFSSLQIVSAVILYLILFIPFRIISGFFLTKSEASIAAGAICLFMGLTVLGYISFGEKININKENLSEILESDNWQHRTAALHFIEESGIDIDKYPAYEKLMSSPHIPERFRLAKAMGFSRSHKTYQELLLLLDDSNFNVVYNAFEALGRRREKKAVGEILKQIKSSDNWYVQLYAYKALRKIGWRQGVGSEK